LRYLRPLHYGFGDGDGDGDGDGAII